MPANPGVSELLTTTLFNMESEMQDGVADNVPLFYLLKKDGFKKTVPGGFELREPITWAENSTASFIEGYDPVDTTPQDVMTAFRYQPKEMVTSVTISKREENMNSGNTEQLFELVAERIDNAKTSMINLFDTGLYSDGTSYSGKQIGGLRYLFPTSNTTGTIGEISRSGNTFAQHYSRSTLTSLGVARSAANIKGELNILSNAVVSGTDKVTDYLAGDTDYNFLLEALQSQQIFEDPDLANAGFTSLKYRGANFHLCGGLGGNIPSDYIWGINRRTLRLKVYKGSDMVALTPRSPVNQLAEIRLIYWMGNLTCKDPRKNAVLSA